MSCTHNRRAEGNYRIPRSVQPLEPYDCEFECCDVEFGTRGHSRVVYVNGRRYESQRELADALGITASALGDRLARKKCLQRETHRRKPSRTIAYVGDPICNAFLARARPGRDESRIDAARKVRPAAPRR